MNLYIDENKYIQAVRTKPDCFNKCDISNYTDDLNLFSNELKDIISDSTIQFASTHLLEQNIWLLAQKGELEANVDTLSRGRVVLVNPGVRGIGREQRFIHPYIVLGEFKETFIGVPITNKAKNKDGKFYLRNFFEVDLIEPDYEKPFEEYRCSKPSVADIRNISGLDKRRIILDSLYTEKKYAPKSYLNAISEKIRSSLAILEE